MYEELQKRIMLVAIWKEMGKKEEEIKTLLAEQGLTSDLIEQIIELTNKVQLGAFQSFAKRSFLLVKPFKIWVS